MIRFGLQCSREHEFEGWFRDGTSYEQQAATGSLSCPVCADTDIRKAVMAPAIARGRGVAAADDPRRAAMAQMLQTMRKVQDYVEKNFDNVGERFPDEARKMHAGEIEQRDIYGKATPEEARSLRDEGVPVMPVPVLPKLDG
ncbi:MAG: DUF1178 family protein [Geminicoccaceae bacterium]